MQAACQAVAPKLGVSWHTARHWVQQARRDGVITRVEEDVIAENARLPREVQELRDTESRVGFFRVRTRPPTSEMITFIDRYRDRFTARVHLCDVEK